MPTTWREFKRTVEAQSVKDSDVLYFINWMDPYDIFVRRGPAITITDESPDISEDDDDLRNQLGI